MNAQLTRSLAELTEDMADAPPDVFVSDVTLDSREVTPGALFLACQGLTHHGIEFVPQAISRGAHAVLFETDDEGRGPEVPNFGSQIFVAPVPRLSRRVGTIADRFFGSPSQVLTIAGITGTNGKTTSAYLLAQALEFCGKRAAYTGTLGAGFPNAILPGTHTTPDAVSVHRQLDTLRKAGANCVCMEVSSHALAQGRVDAVRFHTAVFTNLTRDHLDYHGSMGAYGESKAALLAWPDLKVRVVNVDDAFGAQLAARDSTARLIVTTRSAQPPAAAQFVRAVRVQTRESGLVVGIESSWGAQTIETSLIGDFNVDNVLGVLAVLMGLDIALQDAANAVAQAHAPSGRMEAFGGGAEALFIVDYAHTPDALAKALSAARRHCRGKLAVVFGCGGDRDKGKRPLMGEVAAKLADEIVLTDDNPRSEDPQRIVADIRAGIDSKRRVRIEHDRATAIEVAMAGARHGDVVLIAGKGHEDYQIQGSERRAFSDQAVVRDRLKERACSAR
jgi:UDP-N-acetylmuramoyl-L-alanyl-D-glutamate--2,6-diaminopimelate ligase